MEEGAIGAELLLLLGDFGRSGSFVLRSRHRVFTRLTPPMGGWRASSGPAELELAAGPEAPAPSTLSAPNVYRSGGARLPTCVASGRGRWGGESPTTSSEKAGEGDCDCDESPDHAPGALLLPLPMKKRRGDREPASGRRSPRATACRCGNKAAICCPTTPPEEPCAATVEVAGMLRIERCLAVCEECSPPAGPVRLLPLGHWFSEEPELTATLPGPSPGRYGHACWRQVRTCGSSTGSEVGDCPRCWARMLSEW